MASKRAADRTASQSQTGRSPTRLPRKAIEKIHLGQSFAEYDTTLTKSEVFVKTPALNAAVDVFNPHCFFVGRRGTGKTTIVRYLEGMESSQVISLRPELFSPSSSVLDVNLFSDMKQRPFRSLVAGFRRSLQDQVLFAWLEQQRLYERQLPDLLRREVAEWKDYDFDVRTVHFIAALTRPLRAEDDLTWLAEVKAAKNIARELPEVLEVDRPWTVLIDAIDDFWDGSPQAVYYLTALMHATVEINSQVPGMRVLIFLRENMFERVRLVDSEFARLETCVVGLDWTEPQLLEMVERRVNAPLNSRLELGGTTWNAFFEDGQDARKAVFGFCQGRPRDVLTYCSLALDTAQANKHEQVTLEDLRGAKRRFSDSRLKDLSDEYQENYPQIGQVLSRFYGLGTRFSFGGIDDFLHKLMEDEEVLSSCRQWIYTRNTPELLVRLLFDIGFVGLHDRRSSGSRPVVFRSAGPRDTTPPPVTDKTDIVVHPTYHDALDLQDVLVGTLADLNTRQGLVLELPEALDFSEYQKRLHDLQDDLKTLPTGSSSATAFEDIVGKVLKLCFFRPLTNVQEQVRDVDGTVRRDWIASNRAQSGFWEVMRQRWNATQVLVECKNYEELQASDFHQASYYMGEAVGRLVVLIFRGEFRKHYYQHVKRVLQDRRGLILLLNDRDLAVFVRQSINGKVKDDHLQRRYDETVRAIS
jgi:hypothetical protein